MPATQSAAASPRDQGAPSVPPEPAQCHKCHACHAKRRSMLPSATPARQDDGRCRQVWNMDGVWQSCVWKMVYDKVVCERWYVTKLCVKDCCVWKMVCDKVVWKRVCDDKVGGGGGAGAGYRIKNKNPTQRWGKTLSFSHSNLISCERVAAEDVKSQFCRSLTLQPHFVRKGCRRAGPTKVAKKPAVFDDRTSFRAKGLPPRMLNHNFTSVFDDRTSFRAKGLPRKMLNRNFTAVFGDRTSFRAKRWPFRGASSALPAA